MHNHKTFKDPYTEKRLYNARIVFAMLAVTVMLSLLGWRYFSLQILDHETYRTQSEANRVQLRPIAPKRGLIYDRNGLLLAENIPSYRLTIVREEADDLEATIGLLRELIELDDEQVAKFHKLRRRSRPYEAIPLKFKLDQDEIATLAVNRYRLAGVDVKARLARHYPFGTEFAHVLGYVGRISEREQFDLDPVNYRGTDEIGKIGIEKYYEDELHGTVGYENVETNARGRVLRVLESEAPVPGIDITLHVDAHVQRVAQQALGDERGVVVAIDPRSGGIIAMVSNPSFDANMFVGGISSKNYSALRDSPDLPMFNRALQGQYPPASTIKPMLGLAGLHYGTVTTQSTVADPGWYKLENDDRIYRDWTWNVKRRGHADHVALEMAIVESCDTYYYDLAYRLGIDKIHDFLEPFGLGSKTGVDNTNERPGLLPSREWKRRFKRLPWFPGETVNIGIGQGYMLMTPLQMALGTATVANRGVHYTPRFLKAAAGVEVPAPRLPDIVLADQHWDAVITAMKKVVHGYRGTANRINKKAQYRMAGKTGTAQVISMAQDEKYDADTIRKRRRDHGLFIGFAPVENPKIAVVVVVENGEHGSWIAPVARKVFDAYLIDQGELERELPTVASPDSKQQEGDS